MTNKLTRITLLTFVCLLLAGCFHVQLRGSIGGGNITIAPLRTPGNILADVPTLTPQDLSNAWGQDFWDELTSFVQMALVGIASVQPNGLEPNALYIATASGGLDYDPQSKLKMSDNPVVVQGKLHAIVSGQRILKGNIQISALTEALYQQQLSGINTRTDDQINDRLNAAAELLVTDVDESGSVDYNDVLRWNRSLNGPSFLGKLTAMDALSNAIIAGQPASMIADKSKAVLGNQRVAIEFDAGTVIIDTLNWESPITVANFLSYVRDGFYNQMLVHRAINNFMIQMGLVEYLGEDSNGSPQWSLKTPNAAIINESNNGQSNVRGTLSMARTSNPHSASSQFFINQKDNDFLDYGSSGNPDGYAVFARVLSGMSVVDGIAAEFTVSISGIGSDVPERGVVIESISLR